MITNNAKMPAAIVAAVRNDPYSRGDADISCTTLIGPPMIRHLREQHADDIEEDAADRIWSLVGQAVHAVVERAAAPCELQEERLFATFEADGVGPKVVSGQFDLFDGRVLTDLKVTSVWSVKAGIKAEWEAQLNVLAELLRCYGFEPRELQIVAIARDWRKNEAQRYDDYPARQVVTLPVPLWPRRQAVEYIHARLQAHYARDPEPCTPDERWDKPDTWAVMRKGRKSAMRVLPSEEEAQRWKEDNGGDSIVHRPGASPRCEQYCEVAQWCPYGRQVLGLDD